MQQLLKDRITGVWFGLVAATGLSWGIGHALGHDIEHGLGFDNPRHAGVAILVVAFLKVRFVMLDFMELRHAPRFMRAVAEAWCGVVCAVLIALFWMAPVAT